MESNRYELAGWLTVAAVTLMAVTTVLGMLQSMIGYIYLLVLPIIIIATILQAGFSVYAMIWFRRLLNDKYGFADVNGLITALIVGQIIFAVISVYFRVSTVPIFQRDLHDTEALMVLLPGLIAFVSIAVPLSIIGIVFGVRLLRMEDPVFGYMKPFAYIQIAGCSMMVTIVLMPLGGLVLLAGEILQALILIQSGKYEPTPEFV